MFTNESTAAGGTNPTNPSPQTDLAEAVLLNELVRFFGHHFEHLQIHLGIAVLPVEKTTGWPFTKGMTGDPGRSS